MGRPFLGKVATYCFNCIACVSYMENKYHIQPNSFSRDEHKATLSFKRELGELENVDDDESTFCFPSLRKMRGFKSFLFLILGGVILFGSAALYLKLSNQFDIDLSIPSEEREVESFNKINSINSQIARWSVWVTLVWVAYVFTWFFVSLLPGLIVYGITLIFGYCSEQMRLKLEYISALQPWIVWVAWQVLATISYYILFNQMKHKLAPKYWLYVFQFLFCATIFFAVFFVQRLFVQKIAFDFHKYVLLTLGLHIQIGSFSQNGHFWFFRSLKNRSKDLV